MMQTLRGTAIVEAADKDIVEGVAMVSRENLAFSLVDPATGIVRQPGHPWLGLSVAGKVLVFPSGKGSSSGSYWLLNLAHEGRAPAAIVNARTDAVIAAGAVLGDIPLVQGVEPDPFEYIAPGDLVRVRGGGVIEVMPPLTAEMKPRKAPA
jgi:predicted aconitase with swiveling domain